MTTITTKKNTSMINFMKLRERIAWIMVFCLSSIIINHYYTAPKMIFHGGSPTANNEHKGSCWCGAKDNYCMCTPSLAIDLIITDINKEYIWLVRRRDTSQLATMGGFVIVGESVEQTLKRELKEETGIDLTDNVIPELLGVYSDSKRDKRRHTASVVYVASIPIDQLQYANAGDDVKDVVKLSLDDVYHMAQDNFFCDHKTILMDFYWKVRNKNVNDKDYEWNDVQRTLC